MSSGGGNENSAVGKSKKNGVISLGDGGSVTLYFNPPIVNGPGFDFAVFENAFNDSFLELAHVEISENALEWLSKIGFDERYGARPLKRAVQKHLTDPLALKLLASEFVTGDTINIDSDDKGGFIFSVNI